MTAHYRTIPPIVLSPEERRRLLALQRAYGKSQGLVRRARIVLLRAEGYSIREISERARLGRRHVYHWLAQWHAAGIEGLKGMHGRPQTVEKEPA